MDKTINRFSFSYLFNEKSKENLNKLRILYNALTCGPITPVLHITIAYYSFDFYFCKRIIVFSYHKISID